MSCETQRRSGARSAGGVLRILRTAAQWYMLPQYYLNYKTVNMCF